MAYDGRMSSLRRTLSLGAALSFLAACGPTVETVGGGGTTSSGSTSATTSSGTTTTSSSGGCAGLISANVDDVVVTLASACADQAGEGTASALGFQFGGGPVGAPSGLVIEGCVSPQPGSRGVVFQLLDAWSPGTYAKGTVTYTDELGTSWGVGGDPFQVEVQTLDPVGGIISGEFKAMVTHGGDAAHTLGGSFAVCHTSDFLAP